MKKALFLFIMASIWISRLNAQTGDELFDDTYIHDIYLDFEDPDFFQTMIDLYGVAHALGENPDYIIASITIDGNEVSPNGKSLDTVGVRIKGDFSYVLTGDKKPLKIDINEFVSGQKYDGLKKFNLAPAAGDPSFLKEKLGYELHGSLGVVAPRCVYARIYLNDEYWGLYQIIEQVDKTFLENRFGNKDGNLFKSNGGASLQWIDDNQSTYEDETYPRYKLKTNKTENDWSDLIAFMKLIDNTSDADFKTVIDANFNVLAFLKDLAVQNYIMNNDNYLHGGNNFYVYHNTETEKWEWIPWDLNYSMTDYGGFGVDFTQPQDVPAIEAKMQLSFNILSHRIFAIDDFRNQYLNEVCQLVNNAGAIATIHPRIDELSDAIRDDVLADTKKSYTNSDFESNIEYGSVAVMFMGDVYGMKDFTEKRVGKLTSELTSFGITDCISTTAVSDTYDENLIISISPNPVSDVLTLRMESDEAIRITQIQIFNTLGQLILHTDGESNEIRVNQIPAGTYFINVRWADGQLSSEKFIKQ